MTTPLFLLFTALGCIEPPPSATEGSTEPGGAAKPGAPEPGAPAAEGAPGAPGVPQEATKVPQPHDGADLGSPKPQFTQAELADGAKLNLNIECDECSGSILVRVEDASKHPPIVSTQKSFDGAGKSEIMVPKGISAVLMVVDDTDGNGQPTPGENIGLWTGGLLNTDAPPDVVDLKVGVVPDTPPLPPAEDDPNAVPPVGADGAAPVMDETPKTDATPATDGAPAEAVTPPTE